IDAALAATLAPDADHIEPPGAAGGRDDLQRPVEPFPRPEGLAADWRTSATASNALEARTDYDALFFIR
ncbi:MAG TPA: hypothetical protein VF760_13570, partial [Xanthobacteraceae bacterium]